MKVWAIADLHLSFGVKGKEMDVFGPRWARHHQRLKEHWLEKVQKEDLVLLAGDISWALHLEEVLPDLTFLEELPGTKVMIKGNHDYWWSSANKIRAILPPSVQIIHNDAVTYKGVTIGGTRLWENPEIDFEEYIEYIKPPSTVHVHPHVDTEAVRAQDAKIYKKEIERLLMSLKQLDPKASKRIVMVHYPPTDPSQKETAITKICDEYAIDYCLYGHVHNLKEGSPVNFKRNKTTYLCTAGDLLHFEPLYLFTMGEG
ncbi:MAG: metallophosphoesterase [Verrucomicrobia bacterium]|nr:metallophosphoesterase [Verrucomicrobiota bacterium]